jgi:hypothetical protein
MLSFASSRRSVGNPDAFAAVDCNGDDGEMLRQRQQQIGVIPVARPETLDAPHHHACRDMPAFVELDQLIGEQLTVSAGALAEVRGQFQSLRIHTTVPT